MADEIDYKIIGDDMQIVEIELDKGESVRAEAGAMLYQEAGIEMETNTGGGFFKGLSRAFSGESFFVTNFMHTLDGKGHVAFGAPYPGKIIPLDLAKVGGEFICQRDAFLCAAQGTEVKMEFTKKLGAGFFGGEGFILQKIIGDGLAFIHAGGTIIEKDLKAGEMLKVDTGCVVGFTTGVDYNIVRLKGFKNMLFGGEGMFLATLKGPGKVYVQSLPFSRLANRIAAASMQSRGQSNGVIGNLLGGDHNY